MSEAQLDDGAVQRSMRWLLGRGWRSWKTTAAGALGLLSAAFLFFARTRPVLAEAADFVREFGPFIGMGTIGFLAKDSDVSGTPPSQEAP